MSKPLHADQKFIIGLLENNSSIINQIYKSCSGKVKSFVAYNSGSVTDAEDIFQECLIDIYNQAKYKDLQLSCPFQPFFLMVCKRKWLNALKKKSVLRVTNSEDDLLTVGEDTFKQAEQLIEQQEESALLVAAFKMLGEKCREIIQLTMRGDSQEKVAEDLGITYGYLRKKKSECMASLVKLMQTKN